jgi:hypothetical protein
MKDRKLFVGERAVDSILSLNANVNRQFMARCKKSGVDIGPDFRPWMAMPSENNLNASNLWPKNQYLGLDDLEVVRAWITKNDESGEIPTLEGYPLKVAHVSNEENENFISKLSEARNHLTKIHPWMDALIQDLILNLVPIESTRNTDTDYGMSVIWLKGAVFFEKRQFRTLSYRMENLAHELAHQIIINYQLSDLLVEDDLSSEVYSAIRKKNRPALAALHGGAALTYMLIVAKALELPERIHSISHDLSTTLKALDSVKLTPVGMTLRKEMHAVL